MPTTFTRRQRTNALVVCLMSWLALLWGGHSALAAVQTAKPKKISKTVRRSTSAPVRGAKVAPRKTRPVVSRRVRLARARAAARLREARELAQPRFKVDETGRVIPDIRAEAAIVYNPVTQEILYSTNENAERSIASITKVMTTVVFLENEYDVTRTVTIDAVDVHRASVTYLKRGDVVTIDDLLHLTLIASDNAAARTLARVSPFGTDDFVARMNAKAVELGLTSTHYADPSGLDSNNVSSAFDMARLIAFAASDERIAPIMQKAMHAVVTPRRTITVRSTNQLLASGMPVQGGKTGFIRKSGYCLAALLTLPSRDPVAVVVLGAKSNAARFWEARHLFNWLVSQGTPVVASATPDPDVTLQ